MAQDKKAPAFQFYPKDFLTDGNVLRMTYTERGIYITLLSICWLEGALPADLPTLAAMLQIPTSRLQKLWTGVLGTCFTPNGEGRLHHKRLDLERSKQEAYRRRQSDKGVASAAQRKQNEGGSVDVRLPSGCPPVDVRLQPESNSSISYLQSSSPKEQEQKSARIGSGAMAGALPRDHIRHAVCGRVCLHEQQFEQFVRKEGSREAVKAWADAVMADWEVAPKASQPIGGSNFQFWDARWLERHPVPKAEAVPDGSLERVAQLIAAKEARRKA